MIRFLISNFPLLFALTVSFGENPANKSHLHYEASGNKCLHKLLQMRQAKRISDEFMMSVADINRLHEALIWAQKRPNEHFIYRRGETLRFQYRALMINQKNVKRNNWFYTLLRISMWKLEGIHHFISLFVALNIANKKQFAGLRGQQHMDTFIVSPFVFFSPSAAFICRSALLSWMSSSKVVLLFSTANGHVWYSSL